MPGRPASSSKMPPNKRRRKQGSASVPPLPPARADKDIDVSDEDVEFVRKHKDYVGFLAQLDTKSMTRQVLGLKPDDDGEELEIQYEKNALRQRRTDELLSVEPVDVLPVKTLIGELHFRSTSAGVPVDGASLSLEERRASVRKGKKSNTLSAGTAEGGEIPADGLDETVEPKTKGERRKEAKQLKRLRKQETQEEDEPNTQQSVSSISEQDLERGPKLKARMAEIAVDLLSDPNGNIMTLKELQDMCINPDEDISQLAMLSSMAVFKDLIPGYRIRLPTEKEREMMVSKEVRSLWDYETALLRFYQAYVKLLVKNAKIRSNRWTALRCLCGLLEAVPHFNYRESILSALVPRMSSDDDDCRNMCCEAITNLFKNPGKHGDEATVEAVQLIADFVRLRNCHLHPKVIQVFLVLSFDDDLLRYSTSGAQAQSSLEGHKKVPPKLSKRQEKKGKKAKKQELAAQLRKEVEADFREASVLPSTETRKKLQMLILSSLFETYFRILKTSLEPERASSLTSTISRKQPLGSRPLLRSCLEGLARFSHLISVDFMAPLLRVLQELAKVGKGCSGPEGCASVWERLQCCTVAFKIMRLNMDVLNIDLREFYTLFYNLLLEAVSTSDGERSQEALAEALQIILWEGTHNDMSRVAAFVKRLSTLALHLRSGEAVAALATAQQLLMRYKRCRIVVENNPGSGPVSRSVMVLSGDEDPDLSDSLSTVLWELALSAQHYNPDVERSATTIASMRMATSMVMPSMTPTAIVKEYSSFLPSKGVPSKSDQRKQSKLKKQPLSPFLMTLEERSSQSNGGPLSKVGGEGTKPLFGGHFRILKACRQTCI